MKERLRLVARMVLDREHNPLLRQVDRIETAIMASLVVAFFAAAPLASIYAGRLADTQGLREQRAEQAWKPESARLLQSASAGVIGADGAWDTAWVKARWPVPAGGYRTGRLAAPLNARMGEVVHVWVTPEGDATHPPLTGADLRDRITLAVLIAIVGVAALELLIAVAVRVVLSRRRMAGWESAWRAVGPKWSHLR
ncbi:MAG: hypothetical protein ACLQFR_24360 [Streptosporangiaceae bacterium]